MEEFYQLFPKLPLAEWVEAFVDFLTTYLGVFFDGIKDGIKAVTEGLVWLLSIGPPLLLIVVIALLAWWIVNWKTWPIFFNWSWSYQ